MMCAVGERCANFENRLAMTCNFRGMFWYRFSVDRVGPTSRQKTTPMGTGNDLQIVKTELLLLAIAGGCFGTGLESIR